MTLKQHRTRGGSPSFKAALGKRTKTREKRRSWVLSIVLHLIGAFLVFYFYKPPIKDPAEGLSVTFVEPVESQASRTRGCKPQRCG
jgi:hypothetical protein